MVGLALLWDLFRTGSLSVSYRYYVGVLALVGFPGRGFGVVILVFAVAVWLMVLLLTWMVFFVMNLYMVSVIIVICISIISLKFWMLLLLVYDCMFSLWL